MSARVDMEIFLVEVSKYRFLYDKSCKDFKNSELKRSIWELIGKNHNMSALDAEKKWKVQRDRYNKEKKKIRDSKYSGAGAADVYTPKWGLFAIMDSLLGKVVENASSISSIDVSEQLTFDSQAVCSEYPEVIDADITFEDGDENSPVGFACASFESPSSGSSKNILKRKRDDITFNDGVENYPVGYACASLESPASGSSKNIRKRKRDEPDPILSTIAATSRSISEFLDKKKEKDDKIYKFCDYLYSRIKDLNKNRQREAMHALENLMQKFEVPSDNE